MNKMSHGLDSGKAKGAEILHNLVQDSTVQMPLTKVAETVPGESQRAQNMN
jgi:hypothetical protein